MSQNTSMSAVEIVGTAAAVAGTIGGIMVVRSRRKSRRRRRLEQLVPLQDLEKRAQPAAERGRELVSSTGERVSEQAPHLAEQVSEALRQSRETGRERYRKQVPKEIRKAIERRRLSKKEKQALLDSLRSSVVEPASRVASELQAFVREAGPDQKRAREKTEDLSSTARQTASQVQEEAGSRLRESVLPGLKHGTEVAGERAGETFETLRKRAQGSRGRDGVMGKDGIGQRAGAARGYVAESRQAARQSASRAAERTGRAAKDTTATFAWLALASAIVYFALLSTDRREQVKSAACDAFEQVRLLVLDFRGYEPEM